MERLEIDDIPVFWQQGPAPLSAGLCFGVGRRDESFATGGTTHLVEHLVMGSLPKSHLDRNACVGPTTTEFTATGRPASVAAFLLEVCQALSDLPTERLATEARVLAAEEARSGGDLLGLLLLTRYGATGLGLIGMTQPGLPALTAEQVRQHASRWFVRENAALWLTGPPPDGLRLPLPSGERPVRALQRRLPLPLPAQLRVPGAAPALSFEGPADDTLLTALRVIEERMTDRLRHQGGHSYDVDSTSTAVEPTRAHVAFFADAPDSEVGSVVQGMWEELERFAAEGPTEAELAHDLEGVREYLADPRATEGVVGSAAYRHLDGLPPEDDEERLRVIAALEPEQVALVVRNALDSVLVLVPEEGPQVLPGLPLLPEGTRDEVEGRLHKRRLRGDMPRGSRLVAGSDGVSLQLGEVRVTVRYDDCVALGIGELAHQHVELVGGHGLTVPVCEQDWKDGAALVAEVVSATAHVPRYPVQPEGTDG